MKRTVIWIFSAAVLLVLFMVLCTFVRKPYETVLLERFGTLLDDKQQTRIMYNWYLKMPTDTVVRIDNRLHLWPGPLQQVLTLGNEPITVRTFAAWRISDPIKFYRTFAGSDSAAMKIMGQKLSASVGDKLPKHALDEIFNADEKKVHTAEIENEIASEVTGGLTEQGLQVVQVGFSRMAFPPKMAEAVFARMVAERNTLAQKYRSEGQAQAYTIQGEGQAAAAKTRSDAQKQAEETKGKADAQALEILAAVQDSPAAKEFYQYWKSIEFAKGALSKNTYLVLPTDHPILRALFALPGTITGGAGGGGATTQPSGGYTAAPNALDLLKPPPAPEARK